MKKKLGDITFREYAKVCDENEYCRDCPLYRFCPIKRYDTPACFEEEELNEEVEL